MTRPVALRSLPPDKRVVRRFIETGAIRFNEPTAGDENYPWAELEQSIARGWDPASRAPALHADANSCGYTPFVVEAMPDGVLVPYQGRHRVEVLQRLGIGEIEAFVIEPLHPDYNLLADAAHEYRSLASRVQSRPPWLEGRDDTIALFADTGWNWYEWCGRSVLDVGCAAGVIAVEAARHGAGRVVGFDVDECALEIGRKLAAGLGLSIAIDLLHGDFWDFDGGWFDVVLANQVLYWLSHPERHPGRTVAEVYDRVCSWSRDALIAYTHTHDSDVPGELRDRGFGVVEVRPPTLAAWPTKRTVVGRRVE